MNSMFCDIVFHHTVQGVREIRISNIKKSCEPGLKLATWLRPDQTRLTFGPVSNALDARLVFLSDCTKDL